MLFNTVFLWQTNTTSLCIHSSRQRYARGNITVDSAIVNSMELSFDGGKYLIIVLAKQLTHANLALYDMIDF